MPAVQELDFQCTILCLGKSGVGKTSTINSIFGEEVVKADPFDDGTDAVRPPGAGGGEGGAQFFSFPGW